MLVLSRHVSERIFVRLEDGRHIVILPVAIQGDKVRIGIEAPRTVSIHREEVYEAIQRGRLAETVDIPAA